MRFWPFPRPQEVDVTRDWLSEDEWQLALAQIQRRPMDLNGPERRDRRAQRHTTVKRCLIRVERRGQVLGMLLVRTRNLSSTGACVVHGGRLPRGAVVTFVLQADGGDGVITTGRVAWCRRVRGVSPRAHEIGIEFDGPIDLCGFIPASQVGDTHAA